MKPTPESTDPMAIAWTLNCAANLIDECGFRKRSMGSRGVGFCALGAIDEVIITKAGAERAEYNDSPLFHATMIAFLSDIGESVGAGPSENALKITRWNDQGLNFGWNVKRKLRKAANRIAASRVDDLPLPLMWE